MLKYNNLSSSIARYESGHDYILIEFKNKKQYLYNYKISGKKEVEEMKRLAKLGKGLCSYIQKNKIGYIKK